jgi:hypothetical protein
MMLRSRMGVGVVVAMLLLSAVVVGADVSFYLLLVPPTRLQQVDETWGAVRVPEKARALRGWVQRMRFPDLPSCQASIEARQEQANQIVRAYGERRFPRSEVVTIKPLIEDAAQWMLARCVPDTDPRLASVTTGWFLMTPPLLVRKDYRETSEMSVDVTAELHEWSVDGTFAASKDCEAARVAKENEALSTQKRLRFDYPDDKKLAMLAATGVQVATMGTCLSASDRRLGD